VKMSGLQEEFALDRLVNDTCQSVDDELKHLEREVAKLKDAVKTGKDVSSALARVVVVATILANRLDVDLKDALYKETKENWKKNLRR